MTEATGNTKVPVGSWVLVRYVALPGRSDIHLVTPQLPALSADGTRVLLAERKATLGGAADLRLVVVRVADESVVSSFLILDVGEPTAVQGDGADPERARRAIEALHARVEVRVKRANEALATDNWIPLSLCSLDAPDSVAPPCSMKAQNIVCGAALSAVYRNHMLEIVTGERSAALPGWPALPVHDSTLGTIPVRECFADAWIAPERGVLVGKLEHACQGGGDGCIVQPAWHVVVFAPARGQAPSPSEPPPAVGAPECPQGMTLVPAGKFTMGSLDGLPNERPPHPVEVAAFCLDTTEVTVADYQLCRKVKRCLAPSTEPFCNELSPGQEQHPVNCVTWGQASDFCGFSGKRLPTEIEWEYAARGPEGRKYPFGNDEPAGGVCWHRKWNDGTCPAGKNSTDRGPFGLLDMAGNVSEWTASRSTLDYHTATPLSLYIQRGGDWSSSSSRDLRGTRRREGSTSVRGDTIGFRCAKTK